MDIITILNLILIVLVVLIFILAGVYFAIMYSAKNKAEKEEKQQEGKKDKNTGDTFTQGPLSKESIYKFLDFEEIIDNMIVRKNRTQYVMVIQCQGVNYDLLSEDEKIAVEEGFVQFLNTLRFPIQLYIQTRSLNLKDTVAEYRQRVSQVSREIEKLDARIREAEIKKNQVLINKLVFEKRRKQNVLEYGMDISDYVDRMSLNRNVLQQKNFIVVSYFAAELGNISDYSKEEIDSMVFSELYTRCQSVIRSLATAEVGGRLLDSEELAELLYVAYNRDDSELYQLSKALDAQYDALYSTGKDVLTKRKEMLDAEIEKEAVEIATDSLIEADKKRQKEEEKKRKVKNRAMELIEEYKDQMDDDLYKGAKEQIVEKTEGKTKKKKQETEEKPAPKTRGRKKKTTTEETV